MLKETLIETYTLGLDYGTESGRALLVRVSDGAEVATAVYPYKDGGHRVFENV